MSVRNKTGSRTEARNFVRSRYPGMRKQEVNRMAAPLWKATARNVTAMKKG